MQYTTLSVAFFAALATASQHAPQHFHHRRQLNGTATGPSTTLTVFATQVHTITSCAPTVTNCPARNQASAGVVVTETIALTTTICPVAEASAVSSSIISSAIVSGSGSIIVPTPSATVSQNSGASITSAPIIPLTTGGSGAPGSGAPGAGSPSAVTSDTTLTYTIGTGSSTTVITTTIRHTSTATVYATKPASVNAGNNAGNNAAVTPAAGGAASSGLTTTIQGTSTSTKYVTVVAVPTSATAGGNSGAGGNSPVSGLASGAASCAPVTVTIALSTVTVTATPTGVVGNVNAVTASIGNGKGNSGAAATSSASDNVIVSTATVVPVPVTTGAPFGNGTIPTSTKKPCSSVFPSGFISKSKPSGTGAPIAKFRN